MRNKHARNNTIVTHPDGLSTTANILSERIIRPSKGWVSLNLGELWQYRELLYFLTWRDIKARYKQPVLGAAWAIIQPFFTMVVFSLFFGRLAGVHPMVFLTPYLAMLR
jgi:lipopolysaccharide transport system permease protein